MSSHTGLGNTAVGHTTLHAIPLRANRLLLTIPLISFDSLCERGEGVEGEGIYSDTGGTLTNSLKYALLFVV